MRIEDRIVNTDHIATAKYVEGFPEASRRIGASLKIRMSCGLEIEAIDEKAHAIWSRLSGMAAGDEARRAIADEWDRDLDEEIAAEIAGYGGDDWDDDDVVSLGPLDGHGDAPVGR